LDIYDDYARRSYEPQRYDGKVFYIKSTERPWDHVRLWSEVMIGVPEVIEVQGTHSEIREKSSVSAWAPAVKDRLDQCQKQGASYAS
jgi:thioesterase domain-containing protein